MYDFGLFVFNILKISKKKNYPAQSESKSKLGAKNKVPVFGVLKSRILS